MTSDVLLAQEAWTGTTGASWAGQWTAQHGTAPTIQSNAGRITAVTTAAFDYGRADLTGMTASNAFDLSYNVVGTAAGVNQFASVSIASSADIVAGDSSSGWYPHTGYVLEMQYATTSTAGLISLYSLDSGPQTSLGTGVTFTLVGTTRYSVRLQKLGTTLRGKVWTFGSAEPDAWTISQSATNTYSGVIGLTVGNGSATAARSFDFDDLLVYNGVAQMPSATCGGQTARRTISW